MLRKRSGLHSRIVELKSLLSYMAKNGEKLVVNLKVNCYLTLDREPKQIRERYMNFLRPNLSESRWSI